MWIWSQFTMNKTETKCTAQASPNGQVIYQLFTDFPDTPGLLYSENRYQTQF